MKSQVTCYKVTKGHQKPKSMDHQDALIYLVCRRVLKGTDRNEDKVTNPSRVFLCTKYSKMRSGFSHKVKATLCIFVWTILRIFSDVRHLLMCPHCQCSCFLDLTPTPSLCRPSLFYSGQDLGVMFPFSVVGERAPR